MKFDGIIFDFNGVLWWDSHLQEHAWQQFSEMVRGKPLSPEEMKVHVHGRTNQHSLEYLTSHSVQGHTLTRLTQQKESIYRALCLEQGEGFKLSPGAINLLNFLVRREIPHTIATASEKTNLDFFVNHLQLDRWFDLKQIVYDDGRRPGKPAPDIYLEAANRLELEPTQCIVVEDSHSGIEAAYQAGIGQIVALGPENSHPVLSKLKGVNMIVKNLEEFLAHCS